jgi:acetyltransferase-like isoleucine patch superfamily enzyme
MKKLINYFFNNILPVFLNIYEKWFMYRIRASWGKVHLNKIKNKGINVNIVGYSRFLDPDNLILGDNVRIGYNCFFFCKGGIEIGSNTILSRNIIIYSSNHNYLGNAIPYDNTHIHKPVKIGNGVWIGMGVIITPGVEIGDGAIIGMGTVVSKNINAGEIVVGTGQRTVSNRDMTSFVELENEGKIFSKLWPND